MQMSNLHSLLRRQLKRHFGDLITVPRQLMDMLEDINSAYLEFDNDRLLLERALDLSSQELLESQALYRSLVETLPLNIFRKDKDGRYSYVNAQYLQLIGKRPEEVLGKSDAEIFPSKIAQDFLAQDQQVLKTQKPFEVIHEIPLENGTSRWEHLIKVPVRDTRGEIQGTQAILMDVTQERIAESELRAKNLELQSVTEQLWQTAKLATVGEMTASIAHEINNPLATISLRLEILLEQFTENNPEYLPLKVIEGELDRISGLVSNLLDFSRRGGRQISTINITQEIDQALSLIDFRIKRNRINIIRNYEADVPPIFADRQQLRQVFLNIFTNANDAMQRGGYLNIQVCPVPAEISSPGFDLSIEISDTGDGISPENLTKIWEPFFTTKPEGKGTGLGLPICKRIVEEHGGRITLESLLDEGTTIKIWLPKRAYLDQDYE